MKIQGKTYFYINNVEKCSMKSSLMNEGNFYHQQLFLHQDYQIFTRCENRSILHHKYYRLQRTNTTVGRMHVLVSLHVYTMKTTKKETYMLLLLYRLKQYTFTYNLIYILLPFSAYLVTKVALIQMYVSPITLFCLSDPIL